MSNFTLKGLLAIVTSWIVTWIYPRKWVCSEVPDEVLVDMIPVGATFAVRYRDWFSRLIRSVLTTKKEKCVSNHNEIVVKNKDGEKVTVNISPTVIKQHKLIDRLREWKSNDAIWTCEIPGFYYKLTSEMRFGWELSLSNQCLSYVGTTYDFAGILRIFRKWVFKKAELLLFCRFPWGHERWRKWCTEGIRDAFVENIYYSWDMCPGVIDPTPLHWERLIRAGTELVHIASTGDMYERILENANTK